MNIKTVWRVGTSLIRNIYLKVLHRNHYVCKWLYSCPIGTTIRINKGGTLCIGKHLSAQKGTLISVLPGSKLTIGDNLNLNTDCSIVSRKEIHIGNEVIFGPGCKVYDHDHDYTKTGKERRTSFTTGKINIGNGVWLGANCIVLKDTRIGDNCVFGAGCVIKGEYPANTLIVQERVERKKQITTKL